MSRVFISAVEVLYLELFRVALSEPTKEERLRAIQAVNLDIQSEYWTIYQKKRPLGKPWGPDDLGKLITVAETAPARLEAARDYELLWQRYEGANGLGNERKLNIAEHGGKLVLTAITDALFTGMQTKTGVLAQLRDQASEDGVRGAVDKDAVRKIWSTYRGVVHLGIAIDFAKDNPNLPVDVLSYAEQFRKTLSQTCPKGTKKPYVDPAEQISFKYVSGA